MISHSVGPSGKTCFEESKEVRAKLRNLDFAIFSPGGQCRDDRPVPPQTGHFVFIEAI